MKIVFVSEQATKPSFVFYAQNLGMACGWDDAEVHVATHYSSVNWRGFDVALFMGYDARPDLAKAANPAILTGVLDPRPAQRNAFRGVDFLVLNSIESQDFFCAWCPNSIVYHTFPLLDPVARRPRGDDTLILGYHGNKIHLQAMVPRITRAIQQLAAERPVELWAMYNVRGLGRWKAGDRLGFPVRHIQYDPAAYAEQMSQVDIGLVPQMIPVRPSGFLRWLIGTPRARFNEEREDFLHRFKVTTNIGRHLVFAQYGIPVISDMAPSACVWLDHGRDGFIASSTAGWHAALTALAHSPEKRATIGAALRAKYEATASPETQNRRLLGYLRELRARRG